MFAIPTYAFIVSMFTMIVVGVTRGVMHGFKHVPLPAESIHVHPTVVSRRWATRLLRATAAAEVGLNPDDL